MKDNKMFFSKLFQTGAVRVKPMVYNKQTKSLRLILPILLFVMNACHNDGVLIPVTELNNNNDTIYEIKEWMLIGPFSYDTSSQLASKTYYNNENKLFGFDENGISKYTYNKLQRGNFQPFYANRKNALLNLFDYVSGNRTDKSNFFAYAFIFTKTDREIVMVSDGCSSYSIWLNGEKAVESLGMQDAFKMAGKFVRVKLKKGNNLLFTKINRGSNTESWKLIVGFTGERIAQELYSINCAGDFIYNPMVKRELVIYTGPCRKGNILISNNANQLNFDFSPKDIKDGFISITLPDSLSEGYYKCSLNSENLEMENYFYKGDFHHFFREKLMTTDSGIAKNDVSSDLRAAKEVFDYYNTSDLWKTNGTNAALLNSVKFKWSKNLVEAIDYACKYKSLKNKPGTMLKSFTDKQNGEHRAFLFHVDSALLNSKKKFPVILVPLNDSVNTKMVHSPFLCNLSQLASDCKLADLKGFAICWIFLNGRHFAFRNSADEVNAVLDKLSQDYHMLDTTSVFIFGESIGGQRALMLAEIQPHKYVGLAVYNPFILQGSLKDSPHDLAINIVNTHALFMHGQKFEGSAFGSFRKFVEMGRKNGLRKLSYKQSENGKLEFSMNYKQSVFDYYEKICFQMPSRQPSFIRFKTNDNTFNSAYWISFSAIHDDIETELVARSHYERTKITIKCKNISKLKIDASKLGIPKDKALVYSVNGKKRRVKYDKDGNIVLSLLAQK